MATIIQVPQVAGYDFEAAPNLTAPATRRLLSPSAIKGFFGLPQSGISGTRMRGNFSEASRPDRSIPSRRAPVPWIRTL